MCHWIRKGISSLKFHRFPFKLKSAIEWKRHRETEKKKERDEYFVAHIYYSHRQAYFGFQYSSCNFNKSSKHPPQSLTSKCSDTCFHIFAHTKNHIGITFATQSKNFAKRKRRQPLTLKWDARYENMCVFGGFCVLRYACISCSCSCSRYFLLLLSFFDSFLSFRSLFSLVSFFFSFIFFLIWWKWENARNNKRCSI